MGGIIIELRTENSDVLLFNVFTGELITVPAVKILREGSVYLDFTYPPSCWPVFYNIQPRYDLNGNYIGFTNDDSGEIRRLKDPEEILAKNIQKQMKKWLLIGVASVILLILTVLFIYYGTIVPKIVNIILAVIQFSLIITATIYYLKLRKLRKELLSLRKQTASIIHGKD